MATNNASAGDFFGEGTYGSQTQATRKRDWTANPPRTNAELAQMNKELYGAEPLPADWRDPRTAEQKAAGAYARGNAGATAGYAQSNATTQAAYDQAHRTTQAVGIGRLPGEIANYFGNAQVNLNPFDGAPENAKQAARNQAATDAYANRFKTAAEQAQDPTKLIGQDAVPTGPGAVVPPATGATGTGTTGTTGGAPGATGAGVNMANIDPLLEGLDTYRNDIYALSQDNTGLSVAEAQLAKATALANRQSALNTEASQRSALGMARGVRNRGDRALAERQAIGEASFIGQEAARTDALRQATAAGDLSILRATESNYDREFKLKALEAASAAGLNTAALELDINKVNMADATERMKIALGYAELDASKARDILNFTRDMAAIQFDYDKLSVDDQNETDRLLMLKYQIDQDTLVKLKELKQRGEVNWGQVMTQFVAGAGKGATAAIADSDERVKTNIEPVESTAAEFDELMNTLTANTYEYKAPEKHGEGLRFGFMAQDLERTKLGKHMVKTGNEGTKVVEIAPLALATASGLALVYDRLKALEKAVS